MTTDPDQNPSSPQARAKRLHYIRKKLLRLSRHELQERHKDLNISERSIENWETARFKGLKEEHIDRLLTVFKREGVVCEKYWLLDGVGNPPAFEGIFRQEKTNPAEKSLKISEITMITHELRAFRESYIDAVDAIVQDEALSPFLTPGEWVAGVRHVGEEIEETIGLPCIVQTKSGQTLIRKVEKGSGDGLFNLVSTNSSFKETDQELKNTVLLSSAPIIWWRRPFSKEASKNNLRF